MKGRLIFAGVLLVAAAFALWFFLGRREKGPNYRFAVISRGDVQTKVSATGKLEAVSTVQVGTQVSGQVAELRADFNDRVKQGQIIAKIDATLAQQAVREAQASVARVRAEADLRQFTYDQSKALFEQRVITESEFKVAEYNLAAATTSVQTAQAALERAQRNLSYTVIYAPINGIVVERNVDVGQTVAASLAAPQLFLIAQDLSRMQIVASIDESDIGQIREGAHSRFTVQAYPNETFEGTVRQVRLQSKTTENVVTYSVVIQVANPDGKLLPGMTATVDVLLQSVSDVLRAPNAALRYRPAEAVQVAARALAAADPAGKAGIADTGRRVTLGDGRRVTARDSGAVTAGELWYLDEGGAVVVASVRRGLSDGQYTEVSGPRIREGMQVIVGESVASAAGSSNPFQQTRQAGPGGPPPGALK